MTLPRMPTGIPGLDEILRGGLIPDSTYLIVGCTGAGKTILSLQWLLDGLRRGDPGLFITLAEPPETVARNVSGFGWNLEGLAILDLSPGQSLPAETGDEYHIFPPSEVEQTPTWQTIYDTIIRQQPRRVVIDSVTQLRYLSTDEYQFRKHILHLVNFLNRQRCTTLLTFEPLVLQQETSVALAADGVLQLHAEISAGRVITLRSLSVEKLRGSDFLSGRHPMRITGDGIRLFPHRIETPPDTLPNGERLPFGVAQLDDLMGGGLETHTTTIISGPSGVGKTTLGLQFLLTAAQHGKRAILYTFEESSASILTRARQLGLPVEAPLNAGNLQLVHINPLQLYPDELLHHIRRAVEGEGRQVVMLDSLRGYALAMEQFGLLTAHLQNIVTYLNSRGAITLLVNEIEHLTGELRITELGVSYLVDNLLLLRFAEYSGQVIRVIACLKKRLGSFQPELRRFDIGAGGIQIGEPLSTLRGVLTGVPEHENPPHA